MEAIDFLLLSDIPIVKNLGTTLNTMAKSFVIPLFLLGVIWEFVTLRYDFKGVFLRLVLALLMISFFKPIHHKAKDESFKISKSIMQRYGAGNKFARGWGKIIKSREGRRIERDTKEEGSKLFKFFSKMVKAWPSDIVLGLLWILNYGALLLIKVIYTVVFHFADVTAGITAVLALLPIAKNAVQGPIKATIWCFLVPILTAAIISAMGSILNPPTTSSDGFLVYDAGTYVQMFVFSLLLFGVFGFARKIVSGEGIQGWAEGIGDGFSRMAIYGAGAYALSGAKASLTGGASIGAKALMGSAVGRMAGGALSNIGRGYGNFRNYIGQRAGQNHMNSNLAPTVSQLVSQNNNESHGGITGNILNSVDKAYKETGSLSSSILSPSQIAFGATAGVKAYSNASREKMGRVGKYLNESTPKGNVLDLADNALNRRDIKRADIARNKFAEELSGNPNFADLKIPNSAFRSEDNYKKFLSDNNINNAPQFYKLNRQPMFNKNKFDGDNKEK